MDSAAIARMCASCAGRGRWTRPDTALGVFLEALLGVGLLWELNSNLDFDDEEPPRDASELQVAAANLRRAPEAAGAEDRADEEEQYWDTFIAAQGLRDEVFGNLRYAALSMRRALDVIEAYPWLRPWAADRLDRKAQHLEVLRARAAIFVARGDLEVAAAMLAMEEPELPTADPAFAVFGDSRAVKTRLRSLWRAWQRQAADGYGESSHRPSVPHHFIDGIGRARKARTAALHAATSLTAVWTTSARELAAAAGGAEDRLLLARLPHSRKEDRRRFDAGAWDRLSAFEISVLACFPTRVDWVGWTAKVRVPPAVAEHLLSDRSALTCSVLIQNDAESPSGGLQDGDRAASERIGDVLVPGILDDTPIARRRPITSAHLQALGSRRFASDQLCSVMSASDGIEVLSMVELETRCSEGWRGILLARASDLPDHLIDEWAERLRQSEPPSRHTEDRSRPGDAPGPDFGFGLGLDAGERWLAALSRRDERLQDALRALILARSVNDLRTLVPRDSRLDVGSAVPHNVWIALLASGQPDLEPFMSRDVEWPHGGSGIPLSILSGVQVYTTCADRRVHGKGHAPNCAHARTRGALSWEDDLVCLADILRGGDFDFCSVCGGYAIRRLSHNQLSYYRAAHGLHAIAEAVRWHHRSSRAGAEELGRLSARLQTVGGWPLGEEDRYNVVDRWRWNDVVEDIERRLRALA